MTAALRVLCLCAVLLSAAATAWLLSWYPLGEMAAMLRGGR